MPGYDEATDVTVAFDQSSTLWPETLAFCTVESNARQKYAPCNQHMPLQPWSNTAVGRYPAWISVGLVFRNFSYLTRNLMQAWNTARRLRFGET